MTAPNPYKILGPLASHGPTEAWHSALFLPAAYDDFSALPESARDLSSDQPRALMLRIVQTPKSSFDRGKPKVTMVVRDRAGEEFRAVIFGNTITWLEQLAGVEEACFTATVSEWCGELRLRLMELVPAEWVGRVRPRYKARGVVSGDVREIIVRLLPEAAPAAARQVRAQLERLGPFVDVLADLGAAGWTVEQLLEQVHQPCTFQHAQYAHLIVQRVASLAAMVRLHMDGPAWELNPIELATIEKRLAELPVRPTSDQRRAIADVAALMRAGKPIRHAISGDVGVGKTLTVSVIIAAVIDDAPRRVLLLSPTAPLAEQIHAEVLSYYPHLDAHLVTGDTPTQADLSAPVLIGTSALLYRDVGLKPFDVVIVDEQHRFGRNQREQLVGPRTHLLELSATPIPRTQALIRFGRVTVSEMRQTPMPKVFHTSLFEGERARSELFAAVLPAIRAGAPLLVVYPKRDGELDPDAKSKTESAPGALDDKYSVQVAFQRWEQMFPGRVRTLTSDDDDDSKTRVLAEIASGEAQILVCTTVVEVGLNLPNLHHIAIVCPERFGLMGLHQLRGRTARRGGDGYCFLYCPERINDEQRERLTLFTHTTDGFALAEYDLRRRGAGDLSPDSTRQSGTDGSLLFGVPLRLEALEEVLPVWEAWAIAPAPTA